MINLTKYINKDSRHKLLFMPFSSMIVPYIDIGQELSKAIESNIDNKRFYRDMKIYSESIGAAKWEITPTKC